MKRGIRVIVLTFITVMFVSTVQAEEYNINPGMWETSYKAEVSGLPPEIATMMQQAPKVERECIKDKNYDFNPGDEAKECTFKTTRHSSEKLSWEITCGGEGGNSKGHGEVNFKGDTVSGYFDMVMPAGPAGPVKMHNTFKGTRVGSC
ncbi:MAG: hypothetical protein AMJ55_12645 [Gammaproteobacteria bacterium SG8_15]|nr:MAG: hypothetical protein AMJ55_12645 [Gammaproteobacteria bacterium SG8_15]